jgi:hypothetical protein
MSLLDNIFVNLRIISKIPENGRISTTSAGQVMLEHDNYQTKVWRRLTGDNRERSVRFLMGLINDVAQISDNIINSLYMSNTMKVDSKSSGGTLLQLNENSKKRQQLLKLVRELTNSKRGIECLYVTYRRDANVTAKLEEIQDKIDLQIDKITKALKVITSTDDKVLDQLKSIKPRGSDEETLSPRRSSSSISSSSEEGDGDGEGFGITFD